MPFGGGKSNYRGASKRRTRITLYSSETTKDDIGGQTEGAFIEFGRDHAAIDEIPFIVSATEHGMLYKVTVMYRADIVEEFDVKKRVQVVGGGLTLNLLEIENAERRNVQLILHCAVA